MSPRRPTPARPGSRPGARPTARSASRAATAAPGRPGDKPARPARPSRPETTAPAADPAVLRLGGADGVSVPARVLILALVLLGAFIVTFPSLRGYLSQRAQYDAILHEIAEAEATSTALEAELAKWQDDDYVRSQARERLSYVMPGETTYVVVGADAFEEQEAAAATAAGDTARPWYELVRESARVAGQTGEEEETTTDPSQQGWSTSVPTVPTPSAPPAETPDDEPAPTDDEP